MGRAGSQLRSGAFWGVLARSGTFWGALGRSGVLWGVLGRSGALWGVLGHSGVYSGTECVVYTALPASLVSLYWFLQYTLGVLLNRGAKPTAPQSVWYMQHFQNQSSGALGRFGALWGGAVGCVGALVRSGALRGLLGRSGASWGVLERCGALWGAVGRSGALWVRWRVLGCSGALWGGRSGALWDAVEYSGALWGALGRPEVFDKVTT